MAYSTFVHFKSTDSGAPALATTNGSGNTWLDWILVTKGGWTKIFSGTNISVYQMPGGSGRVIRAVHDSTVSGSTGKMTVRAAASASGASTLVQPFPLVATIADANSTWPIVAAAAYEGVVTESFVSIMMARAATTWTLWMFFGDAVPPAAGDTNNTVIRVQNGMPAIRQAWPPKARRARVSLWVLRLRSFQPMQPMTAPRLRRS